MAEQQPFTPDIVYDRDGIVLCVKPAGLLSESGNGRNLPDLLSSYYENKGLSSYIGTVHRLDRVVGGVMLLSRDKALTGRLIAAVAAHEPDKEYFAVLRGCVTQPEGILEDYLFRDAKKNKTYIVQRPRKGVRQARLAYKLLATADDNGQCLSLVRICLFTGRTHQIRAQFASRQMPVLGDIRYGSKEPRCETALWSCRMALTHPVTKKRIDVFCPPPQQYPWSLFFCYERTSPFETEKGERHD